MSRALTTPAPGSALDCASLSPSRIITMQYGHAVATVEAPVSSAWRVRSALIRVPRVSSIHIRPPPAPQQNVFRPLLSISRSSSPGTAPRTSRGAAMTEL
jgi:hypothetical protein